MNLLSTVEFLRRTIPHPIRRKLWADKCHNLSGEQKDFWMRNGFLVLSGLFSKKDVDVINHLVEAAWDGKLEAKGSLVADVYIGTAKEKRVEIAAAPRDAKDVPYKLNDLYLEFDEVRRLALDETLVATLEDLMGGTPAMCNSLNFERGSQQDFHTDSLYMPAPHGRALSVYESRMAASWIALEDCGEDAGPLRYYPGSHLIPAYRFSHGQITAANDEMGAYRAYMDAEVAKRGLKSETFCPRAGDVLIWHELLFHGGAPILNPAKTRKSLVIHYWRAKNLKNASLHSAHGGYYLDRLPQAIPQQVGMK